MTAEWQAEVARVLRDHQRWAAWTCLCGETFVMPGSSVERRNEALAAHQADALAPVIRRVQAEALREAAGTHDPEFDTEVALGGGDYVRGWLRHLADRIEHHTEEDWNADLRDVRRGRGHPPGELRQAPANSGPRDRPGPAGLAGRGRGAGSAPRRGGRMVPRQRHRG